MRLTSLTPPVTDLMTTLFSQFGHLSKHGDHRRRCSSCFLAAKSGSTAMRLVVDYGEVNKKTQKPLREYPRHGEHLQKIAKCRFKTKMDKRSGFRQVDLTGAAQELLAFVTFKGRVFC